MLSVLIALALLVAALGGVYFLLKNMGEDGVEAAAPGSCRSGSCGVQPRNTGEPSAQVVSIDDIQRKGRLPDSPANLPTNSPTNSPAD